MVEHIVQSISLHASRRARSAKANQHVQGGSTLQIWRLVDVAAFGSQRQDQYTKDKADLSQIQQC
jgi:hypothetical protein